MAEIPRPNDPDISITLPQPQPVHHQLTGSPDMLQNIDQPPFSQPPNTSQPSHSQRPAGPRVSFSGSLPNSLSRNGGPQFQTSSHAQQHSDSQLPPHLEIDMDRHGDGPNAALVASPSEISPPTYPPPESQTNRDFYSARDVHNVTADGFRTLVIVATVFTGIQAQILSASIESNDTIPEQLVNAFWLAGLMLDVFGVTFSITASRWFEILDEEQVKVLKREWEQPSQARSTRHGLPHRRSSLGPFLPTQRRFDRPTFIAMALFAGFPTVAMGVFSFLVGLLIYIWSKQPLLVAIISTVPVPILATLVAVCFTTHGEMKKDIIVALAEKRGEW